MDPRAMFVNAIFFIRLIFLFIWMLEKLVYEIVFCVGQYKSGRVIFLTD